MTNYMDLSRAQSAEIRQLKDKLAACENNWSNEVLDLTDEIERLTAEGARKWISVEDHLPNDRQSVLVHDERHKHSLGGTVFVRMYFPKSRKPWGDHLGITHWMPLPSAPVSEQGDSDGTD